MQFIKFAIALLLSAFLLPMPARADSAASPYRVAVYRHAASPWPATIPDQLKALFSAASCQVTVLDDAALSTLSPSQTDLLILVDASIFPAVAVPALDGYVKSGGRLMCLGGPALANLRWLRGGKWFTRQDYLDAVSRELSGTPIQGTFSDTSSWTHSASNPNDKSSLKILLDSTDKHAIFEFNLKAVTDWDTFAAAPITTPIPPQNVLTCFRAKGSADTTQLSLEWRETDGSRWIAVVPLTTQWQSYALPPRAFTYWQDNRSKGRGFAGDSLHMENASVICVGLARNFTTGVLNGDHTFWISDLTTAAIPADVQQAASLLWDPKLPVIDLTSPDYKVFPVTNLDHLAAPALQSDLLPDAATFPKPSAAFGIHPRPQADGFQKHRPRRFIPLLEGRDANNQLGGTIAAMSIEQSPDLHGAVVINMPIPDPAFFQNPAVQAWVAHLGFQAMDGAFLVEGGAAYNVAFPGETIAAGAIANNIGRRNADLHVDIQITNPQNTVVWNTATDWQIEPGKNQSFTTPLPISPTASDPWTVTTTLHRDGKIIDQLRHQLRIWKDNPSPQFLTAHDGHFYLAGKPFFIQGINYMPGSGLASEDRDFFEYWLDDSSYAPDVVEREFSRIQNLGCNTISIAIASRSAASRNLMDCLLRARTHGLKVNLAFWAGSVFDFHADQARQIIEPNHLANCDTIISYDIAWEPRWGTYAARHEHDDLWRAWIDRHYGNIAAAEKAWNCSAPRDGDQVTGPLDTQLRDDGPWHKMVLDYRQFVNELLGERYAAVRSTIRSIDPNHLVSFRMANAGDPDFEPAAFPYDFAALAHAVDLLAPEGYGRTGDWQRVRTGDFTIAYARAVNPQLPVIWAEFGIDVWNSSRHAPDPGQIEFAGEFYNNFYRMVQESGADGVIPWWLTGGYRFDERSDYGVLNPDGTLRPAAQAMKHWAPILAAGHIQQKPVDVIPIPVNHYVDGVRGLYHSIEKPFYQSLDAGRQPVLTTQP